MPNTSISQSSRLNIDVDQASIGGEDLARSVSIDGKGQAKAKPCLSGLALITHRYYRQGKQELTPCRRGGWGWACSYLDTIDKSYITLGDHA